MRIIFFGSSSYCLPILEAIHDNFQLTAVVTKPESASESFALLHNVKFFTPKDKNELLHLISQIRQIRPDLAIVSDYGFIIPKEIFTLPKYKTLNIHFGKLPKFRGPSPVQYTILFGEKSAWISVIVMDEEMDTGDIVWQKEIPLESDKSTNYPIIQLSNYPIKETAESLYKKLFNIISLELPNIINKYANNELKPQKQDHTKATYTKHLTRNDGFIPSQLLDMAIKGINPSKDQLMHWSLYNSFAHQFIIYHLSFIIEHAVRALTSWPGLWTKVSITKGVKDTSDGGPPAGGTPPRWRDQIKKRLKILKAHLEIDPIQDRKAKPNLVRKARLILDLVQLEGKKPVSWKQFLEGYPGFKFS